MTHLLQEITEALKMFNTNISVFCKKLYFKEIIQDLKLTPVVHHR